MRTCATPCVCKSDNNHQELVLSFHQLLLETKFRLSGLVASTLPTEPPCQPHAALSVKAGHSPPCFLQLMSYTTDTGIIAFYSFKAWHLFLNQSTSRRRILPEPKHLGPKVSWVCLGVFSSFFFFFSFPSSFFSSPPLFFLLFF